MAFERQPTSSVQKVISIYNKRRILHNLGASSFTKNDLCMSLEKEQETLLFVDESTSFPFLCIVLQNSAYFLFNYQQRCACGCLRSAAQTLTKLPQTLKHGEDEKLRCIADIDVHSRRAFQEADWLIDFALHLLLLLECGTGRFARPRSTWSKHGYKCNNRPLSAWGSWPCLHTFIVPNRGARCSRCVCAQELANCLCSPGY